MADQVGLVAKALNATMAASDEVGLLPFFRLQFLRTHVAEIHHTKLPSLLAHHQVRKPAEEALAQAGNGRGFIEVLIIIISNARNDADLRLSAIICLKRTMHRHWRPRRADQYTLADDEKAGLKRFLLGHMEEPEKRVAVQLAVVVADIARREWPGSWDELFPSLMATAHSVTTA